MKEIARNHDHELIGLQQIISAKSPATILNDFELEEYY
jgi:hypothetical protein